MNILIVGDWYSSLYEEAFFNSFQDLGCQVEKFSWVQYFKYYQYPTLEKDDKCKLKSVYYRAQNRLSIGPVVNRINNDLISKVLTSNYDLVFIYRGVHIYPETIKKLQFSGVLVFGYNNDDPFANHYPFYFWRHFKKSIPIYDHLFSYRTKNIDEYRDNGVKSTSLLRSYYLNDENFFIARPEKNRIIEIVFIGHFENDGRDLLILKLVNHGFKVKLYGTGWEKSSHYQQLYEYFGTIVPVYGRDYNQILNKADMSLVFLSKINNDTYTRRVFEIPITKTVMICEYNNDIASLYSENEEIILYKDHDDCINKISALIDDPENIELIKERAYQRVIRDGHEVNDRVKEIISIFNRIRSESNEIKL
ncbi:TPA: CgeB family protein [Photobacterium damselae]